MSQTSPSADAETPAATPLPGSHRELLGVALPLVISSGSATLMYVVDRVFLTWYSPDALAAAMPASMVHWSLLAVPIGLALYTNTFVAQYDGAGRFERVTASLWQAIYLALAGGVFLALMTPFATSIFRLAGHAPAVQKLEVDYFQVLCIGSLPFLLSAALSGFFTGRGKTAVVMWINVVAALLNTGLDYVLIFGWGPLPGWGITGAAVATVSAQATAVVLYIAVLLGPGLRNRFGILVHWRFDPELFRRFLRYGLPNGTMFLADVAGFTVFLLLLGTLGTEQLAATNLAFNINSMAFVPMLGMGTAVMTLVGRRVGEGQPELAVRTTWTAFGLASVYMLFCASMFLFAADLILMPYAAQADPVQFALVRKHVVMLLRFIAVYAFFDAMIIVFSSAVRGAGDTRFALVLTFVAAWVVMVLPTWIAIRSDRLTLYVGWTACTGFIVVMGLGFLWRFVGGQWKSMTVIELDGQDTQPLGCEPSLEPLAQS
ncbi:MAG: MATE family efflux transporter [Planctomycetaceae bacterium]|nr:MATE family efflux transporter [Planctomycetaceae bacterium]